MNFRIPEEKCESIINWSSSHKENSPDLKCRNLAYEYVFIPTVDGTIGKVRCPNCGEEFTFNEV